MGPNLGMVLASGDMIELEFRFIVAAANRADFDGYSEVLEFLSY
jgi:hypothetical protein